MRASAILTPARQRQAAGGLMIAAAIAMMILAALALAYVIYVLWPRWPDAPVAVDAPALPIVIGDVLFRVPPGAIRQKVQRRAGNQERIDLIYVWPALTPAATLSKTDEAIPKERLFVNIATAAPTAMVPAERLKTIYPRYTDTTPRNAPEGLTMLSFRDDTPYRGEDVFYETQSPEHFIARCTRGTAVVGGTCLYERFFNGADVTVRFARAWLNDWRNTAANIDRLMERLQPAAANP
jgi:hypothetical protein